MSDETAVAVHRMRQRLDSTGKQNETLPMDEEEYGT